MSIIRKVFTILLGVTLMFMNISGVKAQDDNTTTDFSNYITAASLDYKEGDKEIAYATDTKLTEDTPLVFKLDADVPSSALSSDHKIDYQLPDNLNVDDTTSDHIYLKDDLTKSVGNYTIADHHMVIDLSTLDYGVDSSKSIELDLETTTSHLIFTDSEAKIYFRKATNESPTEVMVSVLQNYANDTKVDPNSIIKNTNTDTNTKKSSKNTNTKVEASTKQEITTKGVSRKANVQARDDQATSDDYTNISGNIDAQVNSGLSRKYRLTNKTIVDQNISQTNPKAIVISNDVTIDLNGQTLMLYNHLYFDVQPGGHLTIEDSKADQVTDTIDKKTPANAISEKVRNTSEVETAYDSGASRYLPTQLTYYVTEATPNGVTTTDTTYQHVVDLTKIGRIFSETTNEGNKDSTILVDKGGQLDIKGGAIYNQSYKSKGEVKPNHVLATNGGGSGEAKINISGGYLLGNQNGTVVFNNAGNTLTMSGGVITNGRAENGGGIYNNGIDNGGTGGGTIDLSGGVISGNEACDDDKESNDNRYSGAGIYMKSGTLNISGNAYITNNRKSSGVSEDTPQHVRHFSPHGGGGVAADNDTYVKMSGGYVTGNYSNEAGGGLYIGYYANIVGTTQFNLTGGIIAGNVAQTGEGGGIRIGGRAISSIRADTSKVYITNNVTNTGNDGPGTGDWGGGGIFVQENGILNVMNSVITGNYAGGFGGGVSACPTGSTNIISEDGVAIYDNDAGGTHYSRGSGNGGNEKNEDYAAILWKNQEENKEKFWYKDYFLAHRTKYEKNDENDDKFLTGFANPMLGGGSEQWGGMYDKQNKCATEQEFIMSYNPKKTAYFIMLTANPETPAKENAVKAATTFISGNRSGNHGGGIMTNGSLTFGMTTDNYPLITLKAYKSLFVQNGSKQNGNDEQTEKQINVDKSAFYFSIYRHTGETNELPTWNGSTLTGGSGTNTLWKEVPNEASTDNAKAALIKFPVYKFENAGQHVYYLVENKGDDPTMDYDSTIYEVDIDVEKNGTKKIGNNEVTQYSIKSYQIYKIVNQKKPDQPLFSDSNCQFDDSRTDNAITIGDASNPTFKNVKHNYNVTIIKKDHQDKNKVLSGAIFKLYKLDDNNADTSISTIDLTDLGEQTSNADGKISYSGLISGSKYYLVEEEAPKGYNKNGPWIIDMATSGLKIYQADCQFTTVNKKPQLIRISNNSFVTGDGTEIENSETYEITTTVTDEVVKYTMPNTGGTGTYIYYQVGFLLLTLVNIVWIIKRRVV